MSSRHDNQQNLTSPSDTPMKNMRNKVAFSLAAGLIIAVSSIGLDRQLNNAEYTQSSAESIDVPVIGATSTSRLVGDLVSGERSRHSLNDMGEASVVIVGGATTASTASSVRTQREASRVLPQDKLSGPVAAAIAGGGTQPVDLIVRYAEQPELFDDEFVAQLGGEVIRSYTALEMRAIRMPANIVLSLADEQRIDWLSLDEPVRVMSKAARRAANQPLLDEPNIAWEGGGVGVAVLDSGVANHTDVTAQALQYNFLDGRYPRPTVGSGYQVINPNSDARQDDFGHGTHVAGIIIGSGHNSNTTFRGVAPKAKLLSMQVLRSDGSGSMSDVMAALDWLLEYGDYFGIRVVNLSLGKQISESNETDPLVMAVERLWDAGFVVVVAAGNDGRHGSMTINSPGNSRKVITVGSLTDAGTGGNYDDDSVSSFSSRGPTIGDLVLKPDLLAPGNRVVAAVSTNTFLNNALPSRRKACTRKAVCHDNYIEMSGTSMAAPLVAAAAALMIDKQPWLSPDTVKARLMRSARKMNASPNDAGAGVLNIDAAMNETGSMTKYALSPLAQRGQGNQGILIEDTAQLWGHAQWGAGYLYDGGFSWTDSSASNGNSKINATGFLWTDETVQARGYMWTDEIFARGYMWTDEDVEARSLLDFEGAGHAALNDDP